MSQARTCGILTSSTCGHSLRRRRCLGPGRLSRCEFPHGGGVAHPDRAGVAQSGGPSPTVAAVKIRPQLWVLSTLLGAHGSHDDFIEGMLEAYTRLGLLSGEEADRWRERFVDLASDEPRPELDPATRAKAEAFLAEKISQLTPMRREMDEAAIARNAACDAAVWALYRVGALDDDALQRCARPGANSLLGATSHPPSRSVRDPTPSKRLSGPRPTPLSKPRTTPLAPPRRP